MGQIKKVKQDYLISLAVFSLVVFGLIMIYSVSKYYSLQVTNEATDKLYLKKQLMFLIIGVFAWIIFQSIDYRFWQKRSGYMLFITFALLLLPLLIGKTESGGRWIDLRIFSFQPSEVAKLALIFYLSGWFASKGERIDNVKKMFGPFIMIIGSIALLMLAQKDLGTLAIIVCISAAMFTAAGAPIYQLAAGGGLAGFLLWLAIKIEPYRLERFLTFLNPENNSLGAGYHIRNALIAIGSGGMLGLGFGQSKQKYLYLPEAHTDSIFAIISEELGFVRAIVIILVFAFIAVRGYKIAAKVPDTFSRLVACGITTWFLSQMFINIGAMFSILPLTGVPLPFVSYGGSSLVILLAAVGVLVNISKNQLSQDSFKRGSK
ncbi:MAG: putative lipid II flippase FtsW [Patescibacteria group bacterium]|nr:putative lipid II flippase FtsW [Patescibacteria group bacterium]